MPASRLSDVFFFMIWRGICTLHYVSALVIAVVSLLKKLYFDSSFLPLRIAEEK